MIDLMTQADNIVNVEVAPVKLPVLIAETKVHDAIQHIQKVESLEEKMREMPPVELPVKNYFSKGVYARELFIPKGTVLSGQIHKYANLNIMSQGELSILTENGVIRVKAPFTVVSPPGTKRLAYAHEDTIWTTIHGTDETDVDLIEDQFIVHSHEEYLSFCAAIEKEK